MMVAGLYNFITSLGKLMASQQVFIAISRICMLSLAWVSLNVLPIGITSTKIGKNMILWRKIVISHTKYQNISPLPPLGAIFLSAPPPQLKILDPPLNKTPTRSYTIGAQTHDLPHSRGAR
jgi:hypothetical protein